MFCLVLMDIRRDLTYKFKFIWIAVIFLVLILQMGLRWQCGTDWQPYYDSFQAVTSVSDVFSDNITRTEIGYGFLSLAVRLTIDNYSLFLIIHAAVYYWLIYLSAKQICPSLSFFIVIFYSFSIGVLGSNRQLLALGLCCYGWRYVISGNKIAFFSIVTLACFFHRSALIFSIYYFFDRRYSVFQIASVCLSGFVLGKSNLPQEAFASYLGFLGESAESKAEWYSNKSNLSDHQLSYLGIVRRILVTAICGYHYRILSPRNKYYVLLFNGYCAGLFIYLTFGDSLLILVNRGSLYFNVTESFMMAGIVYFHQMKRGGLVLVSAVFLYSIIIFFQSISVYYELFVPYKTVFGP